MAKDDDTLENLVGPTIVFKDGVEFTGAGMNCLSLKYNYSHGQKNPHYEDVASVFVNGELKWQNHNYSQGTPKTTDSVELVLAPRIEYVMKISKTLRFKRPKDKTIKTFLKIEASQVENVYQNDEQLWP
ncbi:hypothetical protein HOE37_05115 [Candidatus Woesearchaeota archaeon]|jgi:hypothetical protein|nr:hypothetical protein [Candidatus Woesearchaeota archaeon]MBT4111212.1 hypothetical protein [Candidatus Woesearchaeota archaeon]MBT4336792.1 hypothetical protein [Candidatus Woesearchaeota archaeon]MBT4469460.1 hypothetical protein [Candidatus Woesearchaeota archaeon]MBT6744145.1 hypothetical protein [Candidatus Woesearchaeota archaeon]